MMQKNTNPPIFGIVPAAGMSRRMGTTKQTLLVGECTMTGRVARTMLDAMLTGVVVVTRSKLVDALDLPEDDRLFIAINDKVNTQMLDSIRTGIDYLDDESSLAISDRADAGVLVIPGDMPTVSEAACLKCVDVFRDDPARIIIATCGGKRGHPIVFPLNMRESLCELAEGLNELASRFTNRVVQVDCGDPMILRDVDTPSDYAELCP